MSGRGGGWEGLGARRKGLVARHRLCMEHGTLEDRGEARARGCKSGREGGSLATVYVRLYGARHGGGARAREHEWEGEGGWEGLCGRGDGWSSARHRLWSTRDARAHIAVRAAAADAPGPGADGSGAPTTRRLVPVMIFSSAPTGGSSGPAPSAPTEPRPAFCPPSSESMAPRRGKDEHGVVVAWADVGECAHHVKCHVSSVKCQVSSVKRQASTQIWNPLGFYPRGLTPGSDVACGNPI